MGTRGLYCVIHKEKVVVAQYGQWDAYPSGQGVDILNFIKNNSITMFKDKLKQVKFINKAKQKEIDKWLKAIGCENGWMNMTQSGLYKEKYSYLSRDIGGAIFETILHAPQGETIWLHNQIEFAAESLFCEWAYVLDLDSEKLEVYGDFNQTRLPKSQRFNYLEAGTKGNEYLPIRCIKKFNFKRLAKMTEEQFVEILTPAEEEEAYIN